MKDSVIFIDDQDEVRDTYKRRLSRLFRHGEVEVIALQPESNISNMLRQLDSIPWKVMYIIDEDLKYIGEADYTGSELIEKIRMVEREIPIYILTGDKTKIDNNLGDVEFVIDKADWNASAEEFKERFFRHIGRYNQIRNEREIRFDELICKHIEKPLSGEELDEFNVLCSQRGRSLTNESIISEADLQSLEDKLKILQEINARLDAME